jgi:cytochrome P450
MEASTAPLDIPDRRRPPAPLPRAVALGPLALYRALRANAVTVWRQEAFEAPFVADRGLIGDFVIVNDPDAIRRVFIDNAANYPKDRLQREKLGPAVGEGLLTSEAEEWRLQRRTVAPLFQPQAVQAYLATMAEAVDAMLARWTADETRDIAAEMTALTYDIIARTVFSSEIETSAEVMGAAITDYFEAMGRIDLWDVLPLPRWLPRPSLIGARGAVTVFREEVRRLLARRRARLTAGAALPDDLVTRLMNARDPETGAPLSDAVIHDNLVTFIGAGHETTANALGWTLFLLSEFPGADAAVAAEAAGLAPGDVAGLTRTRMVLEEAMRLYPPVPFLSRQAKGPDRFGEIEVRPGARIIIAPWVLHRHRALWQEPDLFAPERFAPERRAAIPRFAYLPFGAGPRVCVGNTFALQEALLVLAMVTRRFRLRLVDGAQVMPVARMTLRPAHGLPMRLEKRE